MHICTRVGRKLLHYVCTQTQTSRFQGHKIKRNFWRSAHITEWHERGNGKGKSWTFSYTCLARTLPFENTLPFCTPNICAHVLYLKENKYALVYISSCTLSDTYKVKYNSFPVLNTSSIVLMGCSKNPHSRHKSYCCFIVLQQRFQAVSQNCTFYNFTLLEA